MNIPTPLQVAAANNTQSSPFLSTGEIISIVATGVFGGAVLTIEVSPDNGTTWVPAGITLIVAGIVNFLVGQGLRVRTTVTGGDGSTAINSWSATAGTC